MSDLITMPRAVAEQVLEALANVLDAQSNPARKEFPTIHDYGQARRAHDALKGALAQQAEPVAMVENGTLVRSNLPPQYTGPLYTNPPRQEWKGLTVDDIRKVYQIYGTGRADGFEAAARHLEAMLAEGLLGKRGDFGVTRTVQDSSGQSAGVTSGSPVLSEKSTT